MQAQKTTMALLLPSDADSQESCKSPPRGATGAPGVPVPVLSRSIGNKVEPIRFKQNVPNTFWTLKQKAVKDMRISNPLNYKYDLHSILKLCYLTAFKLL